MKVPEILPSVYECDHPTDALRRLVEGPPRLVRAGWIDPSGETCESWPPERPFSSRLRAAAAEMEIPTSVALAARYREEAEQHPDGEALFLPLEDGGVLILIGERGSLPTEAGPSIARAFSHVLRRHLRWRAAEEERDTLRLRAEESEALHVLGLAANRTLEPEEVLQLVARFTRTLLGAHYVTVSTDDGGRIGVAAAVGMLHAPPDADPFAARIVESGKPLSVGAEGASFTVEELPQHAAEQMQAGLGVPLALFGDTFGALVIGYRRPYPLAPRDTRLALTLAGHAAVAISNARLHREIADRSRLLERAYEELRWSSQAKERFFASMSHELRTPLNAILGYQSLLLEGIGGELPPAMHRFVEKAQRATQNLLLLVNDVLDLSKLEAGRLELGIREVPVREILEDSILTVQPLAEQKGLEIALPTGLEAGSVRTDPDRARQILVNLLSNAVKFTPHGTIALSVTRGVPRRGESAGEESGRDLPEWLEIRVRDTGPGVDAGDRERIFHEFEQVGGTPAGGGTGLGLPISRKLARLLGGDLVLEDSESGSSFVLRLPERMVEEAGTDIA